MKECKFDGKGKCGLSMFGRTCTNPTSCSTYIPVEETPTNPSGMKNDEKDSKLRWDLLPMDMIEWAVKVYTFGAKKYAPRTWQYIGKMEDGTNEYQRYKAALLRHLVAHENGEFLDPESKLPHLAHVLWNAISILYFGLKEHEQG